MKHSLQRSVVFTKPQMDYLQREADRLGISVSDVVRRIIDEKRKEN